MVDGVPPAIRVRHCAEYVVQALGGLLLRQRVRAQEHMHLPVGPENRAGSTSEQGPYPSPSPALCTRTLAQGTHTSSRQCAALSTHCSATRKPPHTCLPFTCTEAM